MTEANFEDMFGIDGEPDLSDELIYYDGVYYTDLPFGELVMRLAEWYGAVYKEVEDYDEVLSKGAGFDAWCKDKHLENKMVIPIDVVEGVRVEPFRMFRVDFPDFNEERYLEFMDELDEYYENLKEEPDEDDDL